jgi:hypothetical protein
MQIAATFSGAGSLSVQVRAGYAASVAFTGTGTLLVSVRAGNSAAATFGGLGNLSARAVGVGQIAARFQAASDASINGTVLVAGSNFASTTLGGQGAMSCNVLQFGPRHVKSTRRTFQLNEVRPQPGPMKRTGT